MSALTDADLDMLRAGTGHTSAACEFGCVTCRTTAAAVERIVARHVQAAVTEATDALDDLALALITSEGNPEGNSLTAAVLNRAANIVRDLRTQADQ